MIRGIGMDLVSISFVEQMLAKCGELFIQQYYSMEERELFACKKDMQNSSWPVDSPPKKRC